MNFAINDNEFTRGYSYDELNEFILSKVFKSCICEYYVADISYNNREYVEPFYIDTNTYSIVWLNDWYVGGDINAFFGFVDSKTTTEYVKHYLWANRYKGGFEYEGNYN